MKNQNTNVVWKDRKRTLFGLPLSFTRYVLTSDKLMITTGIFSLKEEEVKLYRILDLSLKRTFGQRIFGLGTIHCCSSDHTAKEFDIKNIKLAKETKERLSELIEIERDKKRISGREYMAPDNDDDADNDYDNEHDY